MIIIINQPRQSKPCNQSYGTDVIITKNKQSHYVNSVGSKYNLRSGTWTVTFSIEWIRFDLFDFRL